MEVVVAKNVRKVYGINKENQVVALKGIDLTINTGDYICVMGPSGAGKSTLLNVLSTIDLPTGGQVLINNTNIMTMTENQMCDFRYKNLGFIFQDFNLLDNFTIEDNIMLPLVLAGEKYESMQKKLMPIAQKLEIADLLKKFPYEVSGGQKQRTAIARALITEPKVLLADEPTGALDSRTSTKLMKQLVKVNEGGQTLLMVTHSTVAASYASRVMFIKDGEVFHQLYRGNMSRDEMLGKISDAVSALMRGGMDDES